ncbi:Glycoside hydrolase family 2 OS=Streptomyces cyaneofuscatus OX=66883 GN=G3I52_00490 PE=3 SV=1 [Streptomyces cyaneofuscatus]
MLDQGFWPDGLYTQPSDAALTFDLKAQKDLGFNAVRKHIKVESPRWYYHAERLGLLVWQDFVNADIDNDAGKNAFLTQGKELMKQFHNYPSISGWIVFNEGWGEWDRTETGKIAEGVKALDPSRVVNAHSGVNCCASKGDSGKGEIIDHHDYVTRPGLPGRPPRRDGRRARRLHAPDAGAHVAGRTCQHLLRGG